MSASVTQGDHNKQMRKNSSGNDEQDRNAQSALTTAPIMGTSGGDIAA